MIAALVLALTLANTDISGVVHDSSGAVVPGASIVVRSTGGEQRGVSGPDGRFTIVTSATGEVTLVVRADGFAERQQRVAAGTQNVDIVLEPASLLQAVTVTATRTERRLGDVPASVTLLDSEAIRQSPAVVADDVLRQLPEFSLFRRTSSLSAHPTAQGVSLRGIGPSGVSRTLVLLDGVPFNDPFGGWVYWSRVPLAAADRIEVVDGASSSLYGNYAMGGVINIMTSRVARPTFELKTQYGNLNSPKADFFAGSSWGPLMAAVDGSVFNTDGYPIVAPTERGRVDNNATDNYRDINLKLDYRVNERVSAFGRVGYFRENRDNGKASTIDGTEEGNNTRWTSASGGVRLVLPDQSSLQANIFSDFESFHSNFLAVPAANPLRSIGRMTLNQAVPTTGVGGSVQWSRALTNKQFLTAGGDWRRVDGDSQEDALDPVRGTTVTLHRVSGGTQQSLGAFVQDMISPVEKLEVTLSARIDHWRNYDAHNLEHAVPSGLPAAGNVPLLPERNDTVASPRVAAIYHLTDRVSVWGDLGWGFRAPTLNELYRQFRVGNVLTLANNQLGAERLVGGEAGLNLALTRDLTWRTTWFDNRIKDPVSNVTVAIAGTQITRQRQNLGGTRIRGLQTDLDYRLGRFWRFSGGYLYDDATVREFAVDPTLVGRFVPQVPKHRGSAQVTYSSPRVITIALQTQFVARQFDDDQNLFSLPGYTVADLQVTRMVTSNLDVFVGAQNMFDQQVVVGSNPTLIGAPRLVNAGIRVRFGR